MKMQGTSSLTHPYSEHKSIKTNQKLDEEEMMRQEHADIQRMKTKRKKTKALKNNYTVSLGKLVEEQK